MPSVGTSANSISNAVGGARLGAMVNHAARPLSAQRHELPAVVPLPILEVSARPASRWRRGGLAMVAAIAIPAVAGRQRSHRTNSMPGASVMRDAQYGNGTQLGGRQYANILGGIAGRVADWQGAGRLSQKIGLDTGLVGLGLDLANRGRSLNFNPTPSTARRAFVNPSTAGVVAHWTADDIRS